LLEYVPRQLKDLYKWLEKDFHPLKLTERVNTSLKWIKEQTKEPELVQYIEPLQKVVVCRVLQQVSTLYQSIKLDRLLKLLPFCTPFELEQMIVDASRNGQLQARIDHNKNCIYLGTDLNASPLYVEDEFFETQRLQALPSERVSDSFNKMAKSLMTAHHMLNKEQIEEDAKAKLNELVAHYNRTKVRDHQKILKRKQIIEQRKEEIETLNMERELKEQRAVQQQEEAAKVAEQARLTKEQQEREAKRKEEIEKEEKRKNANDRLELFRKSEIGQKILKDIDVEALEKINPEELMKKQVETLEKEKKEMTDRLKAQEKKFDHFERAKRLEEIPLLKANYEVRRVEDKKLWDEMEADRIRLWDRDHKMALENKKRLARLVAYKDEYVNRLNEERNQLYQQQMEEFEAKKAEIRKERLAERRRERKHARYMQRKEEKQMEEERAREEQMRLEQEEKERARLEEEEEKRRAYEIREQKMREQENKQRERELAIEKKIEAAKNMSRDEPPARGAPREEAGWRTVGPDSDSKDSWRSRRGDPPAEPQPYRAPNRYRPPNRRDDEPSSRFGAPRRDDAPPRGFPSRRDSPPRSRPGFGERGRFDRDDGPRSGGFERKFDDGPRRGFTDRRDDGPPRRDFMMDRDRDFQRPSTHGQSSDEPWRRRGPPAAASPRRKSPAGISPPRRRSPPPGRSDSPPRPRRSSPAGRRSPPPTRGAWRQDAPPATGNAWRTPQASSAAPSSGGAWRSSRQMQSEPPASTENKYRPPQPAADRPYRPRSRQLADEPPQRSNSRDQKPPQQQSNGGEQQQETPDEWVTVKPRR